MVLRTVLIPLFNIWIRITIVHLFSVSMLDITCVLLAMAAVKGSVGYVVILVIGVLVILCYILLIMFMVTIRRQTTQSRGTVHLSPEVT